MKKKAANSPHSRYDDDHHDMPTSNELPHYGMENQVRGQMVKQGAKNVYSNPGSYGSGSYGSGNYSSGRGVYNPYGGY